MSKKILEALDPVFEALRDHDIYCGDVQVKYSEINFTMPDIEESYMFIEEVLRPHFPFYINDMDDPEEEPENGYDRDKYVTMHTHLILPEENDGEVSLTIGKKIKYTDFIRICEGYLNYLESGDDSGIRVHEAEYSEVVEEDIDKNIKSIVELFNLMGATTISSCEGKTFTGVGSGETEIVFLYDNNIEFILDVIDEYFPMVTIENEVEPCGCTFKQSNGCGQIGVKYSDDGELVILKFGEHINFKRFERLLIVLFNIVAVDQTDFNYRMNGELSGLNESGEINPLQVKEVVKKLQKDIYDNSDRDNMYNLRVVTENNDLLVPCLNDWDEDIEHDLMVIDPQDYKDFATSIDISDLTNINKVHDMVSSLRMSGHL